MDTPGAITLSSHLKLAGAGDDKVTFISTMLTADDTVEGGDGTDTLVLDDGDDAAGLDATTQTGFEQLELGAAGAAVTLDNADFKFTKVLLGADLTQDLTVDNMGDGTLVVQAAQAGAITVGSTGDTDTLNVVVDAGVAVTLASLDVTGVETVNITTTDETDDTTLTAIEVDGVNTLSFGGAGDVTITDITDADTATKLATVDLSNQTGNVTVTANTLGYGTAFKLGAMGDTTDLIATVGSRDTFQFTTAFAGEVSITGGEFGGDVTDDRIDLSAITGIDTIDNLTFTDNAGDLEITSEAFEGTIVLVGITGAELNNADFVF